MAKKLFSFFQISFILSPTADIKVRFILKHCIVEHGLMEQKSTHKSRRMMKERGG